MIVFMWCWRILSVFSLLFAVFGSSCLDTGKFEYVCDPGKFLGKEQKDELKKVYQHLASNPDMEPACTSENDNGKESKLFMGIAVFNNYFPDMTTKDQAKELFNRWTATEAIACKSILIAVFPEAQDVKIIAGIGAKNKIPGPARQKIRGKVISLMKIEVQSNSIKEKAALKTSSAMGIEEQNAHGTTKAPKSLDKNGSYETKADDGSSKISSNTVGDIASVIATEVEKTADNPHPLQTEDVVTYSVCGGIFFMCLYCLIECAKIL